jgi:hypothetical protein
MTTTRAYALPLVMMLLLILAGILTTLIVNLEGSIAIGESAMHRRQAFHMAEGVQVAAVELAAARLRTLPIAPDLPRNDPGFTAALQTMLAQQEVDVENTVNATLRSTVVPGYRIAPVDIASLQAAEQTILADGAFAGMQAQVQRFDVTVEATREDDETEATVQLIAEVQRATISMFQFYVFADGYLDLDPGGPVTATGRIHTNGDFCIAGQPVVDTVTAAGRVLMSNPNSHGLCRRRAGEGNNIRIATDDNFSVFATMTFDHTSSNWPSVETTFNRHLLDRTHNVTALRMPVSGQPRVQAGANVLAMEQTSSNTAPHPAAKEDNTTSMRFLVDPVLVDEPDDVRRQKFAFKADLRIIDGMWFLRDPANPADIGTPIWSDHVGDMDVTDTYADFPGDNDLGIMNHRFVGQEDLRGPLGWGAINPHRFSYYGFTDELNGLYRWTWNGTRAVVSYGVLHNEGGNTFSPGRINAALTGTARNVGLADFLAGMRSGFKNGWIEARSESSDPDFAATGGASPEEVARSRLLPLNFDVAAFIAALHDCSGRELGSYFPGTCGAAGGGGRRFNGIVYVSATWPGSLDGLGSIAATHDFATLWPSQPLGDGDFHNAKLPMPLCGKTSRPLKEPTGGTLMQTEACGSMSRASGGPFVNFVRVFNAQHINPPADRAYAGVTIPANALPGGLTIATNLPIAVLGHANLDTTPKTGRNHVPAPDHFVPFLIAGDRFHRQSVAWDDFDANWREPMKDSSIRRLAQTTTQHLEILAGWNPTPVRQLAGHDHSSDGFEDFPRYNERWNCDGANAFANYFGSIVVAFASVYERTGANNDSGHGTNGRYTTCFPRRNEGFDFHLEDPNNQPPGAPLILAQSVGFVARR